MARFLGDMTWVEAGEAARRGAIILLPQSPTEQHGPQAVADLAMQLAGE